MVHFHWYPHYHLRQSEVDEIANEVSRIIRSHIPSLPYEVIRIPNSDLGTGKLANYAHSIHVTRVKNHSQLLWTYVSADFISVAAHEIDELLRAKESKVPEYLKRCKQVWLVIVADGQHISSNVELVDEALSQVFRSGFERILFYDRLSRKVFELNTIF